MSTPTAAAGLVILLLSACTSSTAPPGPPASTSPTGSPKPAPVLSTYTAAGFATALAWAPDKRLFFAERSGTIRTFDGASQRVFATVRASTDGERGLLGLALSPTFDRDHFVYAFYSRADDTSRQRVVRWLDRGGTGTNLTTIIDNLPAGSDCCHKGGRIAFGPDGKLYVTLGETHVSSDAQNSSSLRGKILRYNPDGTVPSDNPFGRGNPVWAIGLRNPFGLAFSSDGKLMVTDNGPSGDAGTPGSGWDEVDLVVRGGNYQWPTCYGNGIHLHGFACAGTPPTWQSGAQTIIPTGATFISAKGPTGYQGDFAFCSYADNRLKVMSPDATRVLFDGPRCQLDVKEGPDHALYLSDTSAIYRFGP
ncbi:MAG: PQQ-dependent sugar dehydrogenase [Chloroflexi bacterium]|nr:MAG: PQQ-dependent sugar dehydrogenase [Chloroflexota bacterium]